MCYEKAKETQERLLAEIDTIGKEIKDLQKMTDEGAIISENLKSEVMKCLLKR